jgi:fumarate hydratase class II
MTDTPNSPAPDGPTRTETDSLGTIDIPADRLWGPQTERARRLFRIGTERFPPTLIRAGRACRKRAAAEANRATRRLRPGRRPHRGRRDEVAEACTMPIFPLPVWQHRLAHPRPT